MYIDKQIGNLRKKKWHRHVGQKILINSNKQNLICRIF